MAGLDDTAIQALLSLSGNKTESIGLLYEGPDGFAYTNPSGSGRKSQADGTFKIPAGSLRGLFHNHPPRPQSRGTLSKQDRAGELFSDDDRVQARKLGVPSYIITPSGKLWKYDPASDAVTEVALPVRTSGSHNTLTN